MGRWTNIRHRYKDVVAEYGIIAVGFHLMVFFALLIGGAFATSAGLSSDHIALGSIGHLSTLGAIGGGYALTQVTSPFRILLTIVATPVVARTLRRLRHVHS